MSTHSTAESSTTVRTFQPLLTVNGAAKLLAISIMLQGNRSVGELTQLLSKLQNDLGEDGQLTEADNAAALAEGASVDVAKARTNRNVCSSGFSRSFLYPNEPIKRKPVDIRYITYSGECELTLSAARATGRTAEDETLAV